MSTELTWLAGLWEGEGCFTWPRNRGGPVGMLNMTDEDVVTSVAEFLNECMPPLAKREKVFRVYSYKHGKASWKRYYRVHVNGRRALHLMALLRPYLHERRRAKVDELLERAAIQQPDPQ